MRYSNGAVCVSIYETSLPLVGARVSARTSITKCQATRVSGIVGNDTAGAA